MGTYIQVIQQTALTLQISIMKVFYFMFCLASVSALQFGPGDEEEFKAYLQNTKEGLSGRNAGCKEKEIRVNGKDFNLLSEECSQSSTRGENVLQQNRDGNIVTKNGQKVFSGGIIDQEIFDLIFPGFEQKEEKPLTTPTTTTQTEAESESDAKTNSANYAGLSYLIATVLFFVQMI